MPLDKVDLSKYLSDVFIETGTHRGDGVRRALDAGFSMVLSCEPNVAMLARAPQSVLCNERVMVGVGSSRKWLPTFLQETEMDTVTLWLDAHPDGELAFDDCPLAEELRLIVDYRGMDCFGTTILIDDMRLFSKDDQSRIEDFVRSMHPSAEVYRIDGHCADDILVGEL